MGARRRYTTTEIEQGLAELVLVGNSETASKRLAARGLRVSAGRLRSWRTDTYVDRYLEVRRRLLPQIRETLAQAAEDNAKLLAETERQLAQRLHDQAGDLETKDLGKAVQSVAIAMGINVDKTLLLRGEPTQISMQRAPDEILAEIDRRLHELGTIDGTATEIVEYREPSAPVQEPKGSL